MENNEKTRLKEIQINRIQDFPKQLIIVTIPTVVLLIVIKKLMVMVIAVTVKIRKVVQVMRATNNLVIPV